MTTTVSGAVDHFEDTLLRALQPDPTLSVWAWAEKFRILPSENPEPGPKSYDRTPALRAIAEALSMASPYERVVFLKGSQIGATDLGADWIGHTIHLAPSTILLVWPTVEFAQRKSRELIDPLIETTPALRALVAPARTKDAQNTILVKKFTGGRLVMTGANSGIGLRSTAAQRIYLDELDSFAMIAGKEGDPVRLATRAARTFKGRTKVYIASTPLDEATSLTTREFNRCDVVKDYHLPCPFCGVFQKLDWERMRWETRGEGESVAVANVHYECSGCAGKIENHHKATMLPLGKWVDRWNNSGTFSIGFHLSALYSPVGWYSWDDAALAWVHAKGNPNEEKPFVNTVLGLPYHEPNEAPDWQPLFDRREPYAEGIVQPGCRFLTMGVDVNKDWLGVEVMGWGRDMESWSLLYKTIPGDPLDQPIWDQLSILLHHRYPTREGDGFLPIWCCGIDSGKYPYRVYRWVRAQRQPRFTSDGTMVVGDPQTVFAIKGRDEWFRTLITAQKTSAEERKRGVKIVGVGVSKLKKELYQSLRLKLRDDGSSPPGYRHWPQSYDRPYFKGLIAEKLVVKLVNGKPKEVWEDNPSVRSEPLDCDNYARAAATAVGIDKMGDLDWTTLEAGLPPSLLVGIPAPSKVAEPSVEAPAVPVPEGSASVESESPGPVVLPPPLPSGPPVLPAHPISTRSRWSGRTRISGGNS